ncbi:hypothetical protein PRIPAC_91486 [Pristionchus pacificus]|uniref:Uncharacterized protein n=1 Tax=Pristionchus pacificus TaxID=54126 RepID=A0A2A6BWD1_PRIPA|nr:hypothetical protein PRIPAC_91486 [Pristionchus pacificus]|eukprot:PDM70199.1 hypothetical protein PRIPAC_45550 [Pristionchus pacificus]
MHQNGDINVSRDWHRISPQEPNSLNFSSSGKGKNCFRRDVIWNQLEVDIKNEDVYRHQHPREPRNTLCQTPPDLSDSSANGLIMRQGS